MRKIVLLLGILLLLSGIVAEALYIATNKVAYSGVAAADSYLVTGIIFILLGFILTLSSVKIPKVRVP